MELEILKSLVIKITLQITRSITIEISGHFTQSALAKNY